MLSSLDHKRVGNVSLLHPQDCVNTYKEHDAGVRAGVPHREVAVN